MKDFLKFVFASCLGVFLAGLAFVGCGGMAIGSLATSFGGSGKIKPNSVLTLSFKEAVPEKTNNIETTSVSFEQNDVLGLEDIKRSLEMAGKDKDIKGILLDLDNLSMGQSTARVLRKSIETFKKESGKFVFAYSNGYSQGAYYLASAADSIFLNPVGSVDFRGFAAQIPFFKNMLDRLGIKAQVYYAGNFKSATEPFRLDKMSDYNRLQVREYVEGMYDVFLSDIAASRKISKEALRQMADEYAAQNAKDALRLGLVDKLVYRDYILDGMKNKLGLEQKDKIPSTTIADYSKKLRTDFESKDKVAVVYAEGEIVDGEGSMGNIGGDNYAKMIRKIRQDDSFKAIVLRVNSGGGSALASENIWRELSLAKEKGLPIVVSMGDMAASGGYYISCMADSILAEPNTLTGSIGVFSMIPSLEKTFNDKLGITFDTVKTTKFSLNIGFARNISDEEGKILQKSTDEIYDLFLTRVANGRKMTKEQVHEIAQGRVWTGKRAHELGLVDEIGDLESAIAIANGLAKLNGKYHIKEYPLTKQPLQQLLDKLQNKEDETALRNALIRAQSEEAYQLVRQAEQIKQMQGVQMRIPFEVNIW
jgi:protease-4